MKVSFDFKFKVFVDQKWGGSFKHKEVQKMTGVGHMDSYTLLLILVVIARSGYHKHNSAFTEMLVRIKNNSDKPFCVMVHTKFVPFFISRNFNYSRCCRFGTTCP
jgi:hypothetical protein